MVMVMFTKIDINIIPTYEAEAQHYIRDGPPNQ
jgi:hypothetical protein